MTASDDLRVLVISVLGRDAELIKGALDRSGIQCHILDDVASAIDDVRRTTAGALLVTEEALGPKALNLLTAALAEQPAWSDLPVLVLTRGGRNNNSSRTERRFVLLGTITLLERPMHVATLVSSVKAALRARSRQYERRLAEEALRKSDKLAVVGRLASSIAHEIKSFGGDDERLVPPQRHTSRRCSEELPEHRTTTTGAGLSNCGAYLDF